MQRRWAGILITVMALLAAVVVPRLGAQVLAGSGVAEPTPGPPAIGDCLTTAGDAAPMDVLSLDPLGAVSPCSGRRFGEVVQLFTENLPAGLMRQGTVGYGDQEWLADADERCIAAGRRYIGLDATSAGDPWEVMLPLHTVFVPPTARQRAAGQRWVACALSIGDRPARRSLKNVIVESGPIDDYGICTRNDDWLGDSDIPCSENHSGQTLAHVEFERDTSFTTDQLERSCRQLISALTKMADITAAGRLRPEARIWHFDSGGNAVRGLAAGQGGLALCGLRTADSGRLNGTLLQLGTRPVPWA